MDAIQRVSPRWATDYSDELMDRDGQPAGGDRARRRVGSRLQIEQAMDALRCPPPRRAGHPPVRGERRRVALCRLLLASPICCCSTSRPTISTQRVCNGWSSSWPSTRERSWPSPTIGTFSTTWRNGFSSSTAVGPIPTRATTPPIWRRRPNAWRWLASGPEVAEAAARRAGLGATEAKARQAKCRARLQRYEEMAAEAEQRASSTSRRSRFQRWPRLGSVVVEVSHLDKGFEERMLIKDLVLLAAPQRNCRHHWTEWSRQDHPVQDDHRGRSNRTPVRSRSARR